MKKVALIVDVRGWAFDLAAGLIKRAIQSEFEVDIFYSKSEPFNEDLIQILQKVKDYDIIHFFWRKTLQPICDEGVQAILKQKNIDMDELKNKLSTGVYDHLFIEDSEYDELFNNYCKKYVVSSRKLYEIYSSNSEIKKPDKIMGDTFDEALFYPQNTERFGKNEKTELVLGWVGNTTWNSNLKDQNGNPIDFKGYHTVLKPVVEELQSEGYNIKLYCADKKTNFIPNEKMCDYYGKIDTYICVSISEGTPKPLLEAMGTAVPIITTDVGVAEDYLGEKQKEFILPKRFVGESDDKIREVLKAKIVELYNNRKLLSELSKENYERSKKINFEAYKEKYLDYFLNF